MWRVAFTAQAAVVAACEAALAETCETVSRFEDGADGWRLEGLSAAEPDRRALGVALVLAAVSAGAPVPQAMIEPLADRDWLAENREQFAPFRVGRFRIRDSSDDRPAASGLIDLRIEAATAFGSGRHASTAGCLRALQMVPLLRVGRAIDVGCGSGILAIAAAKLLRAPVLATDCDPAAVAVARANAWLNGVPRLVRTIAVDGWRAPAVAAGAPYDLVLCNILARPLKRMAAGLAGHLAPGGVAILAGLLARDGNDVLAAHRAAGLRLLRRIDVDGWRTLVLTRP
jgi:ribosomal protein L11 methyltransferase